MTEGFALHEIISDEKGEPCDYRFLDINPAFERLTGLKRDDVIGATLRDLLPDDDPKWVQMYGKVALTGKSVHFENYSPALNRHYAVVAYSPAPRQFAVIFTDITERKHAEEELRRSREDLDRAQEVGQIGSWRLDTQHNVLTWSDENHRIFGVPKGTPLTYETFLGAIHPDDRQHVDEQWNAALRGEPYNVEHRIVVGEQVKWVREKAYLEFDDSGRLLGGFGITQDITELKQAVESLSEARARAERTAQELQAVFEAVPAAVWIAQDPECEHISGNAIANQFYEAEEGDNVSANSSAVRRFFRDGRELPPDELPMQYAAIHTVDTKGDEFEVLLPSGGRRYLLGGATPLRGPDGQVSGCVGAFVDITARKQAEEALAQSRAEAQRRAAELQSFVSNLADGVSMIDADGRVVWMNDGGREILRVPRDEDFTDWMSRYETFTLDGKPLPVEKRATYRALRGERVTDTRYRTVTPYGDTITVSASASPVFDGQGQVIGATSTFRDQSARVAFEEEKQRLLDREHRIAEMLQQALVPTRIPQVVSGCHFSARYVPALDEAQVGGDFYDVFDLDCGRVGVLIGDVAGKGLVAAMQVSQIRHAFRSYAYIEPRPSLVVGLVNEALCRDQQSEEDLFTAFFAVVDTDNCLIRYTNAGHEPPVVRRANGSLEELSVGAMALGVLPGCDYPEGCLELEPGDLVVLVTDGVTEARSEEHGMFDKCQMMEFLARQDASPPELVERLLQKAMEYGNGLLKDDVAIVALGLEKPCA